MTENHSLNYYLKFHELVRQLYDEGEITSSEKNKLKLDFTMSKPELMTHLINIDDYSFKEEILDYLRNKPSLQKCASPTLRRRSLSQARIKKSVFCKECTITEEQLLGQIQHLQDQLFEVYQARSSALSKNVHEQLKNLSNFIIKLPQSSPVQSLIFLQEQNIVDQVKEEYKGLKENYIKYMNSLQILVNEDENIVSVLRQIIKNLLNCDEYTFIAQDIMYSSKTRQFSSVPQPLLQELTLIHGICTIDLDYPILSGYFKEYNKTYVIKVNENYFIIHQNQFSLSMIEIALEYKCKNELEQLANFIIITTTRSRVQQFSPNQVGNMILDIGVEFVRCSKYLLIHQFINILRQKYAVEKIEIVQQNSQNSLGSLSPGLKQKNIILQFKDIYQIELHIAGMNLSKQKDLLIYQTIQQLYTKYTHFIEICYDRVIFYKFFMKSSDSLIFEFDKKGQLQFLSRPIPQSLKDEYNIQYKLRGHFTEIFLNNQVRNDIEQHLQNKWAISEQQVSYEVFMKIQEKKFKGFAVIFSEGFIKSKTLDVDFKQLKLQKETTQFITNLEQQNPEIKDTIFQLYLPQYNQIQTNLHQDKRRKCIFNSTIDLKQQVSIINLDINDVEVPPEYEIDTLDFNILKLSLNSLEKQRVVYSILLKINFSEIFNVDEDGLCEFLSELEYNYNKRSNPFHNYDHGVNVMHSCHMLYLRMQETKYKGLLDDITRIALIFGGLCHDVGHTGRTNVFEMNKLSQFAIRYHDKSVLEQYHAAKAIKLMIKFGLNQEQQIFRKFRLLFIENILHTDNADHFNLIKIFDSIGTIQENEIKLITGMMIHASDFAGGSAKWPISRDWSLRVNQEFQSQYEEEGRLGLPQQPYMKDLDKMSVLSKSEIGFYKFIVRPLYVSLSKFLENKLDDRIKNLDETIIEWDKLYNENVQKIQV